MWQTTIRVPRISLTARFIIQKNSAFCKFELQNAEQEKKKEVKRLRNRSTDTELRIRVVEAVPVHVHLANGVEVHARHETVRIART